MNAEKKQAFLKMFFNYHAGGPGVAEKIPVFPSVLCALCVKNYFNLF